MPARSNQFQKMICYIVDQLAPFGAKVEESALLYEQGLSKPIKREVDILLSFDAGIDTVRVAVECRGRSRKQDIAWIDDMIGRFRNVAVNKVIAVSEKGFSARAREKAVLNNITLMSLADAVETDWTALFTRIGFANVIKHISVDKFIINSTPKLSSPIAKDDVITVYPVVPSAPHEPLSGPAMEFVSWFQERCSHRVTQYFKDNRASIYKVLADLEKDALIENAVPMRGIVLTKERTEYHVRKMGFIFRVKTECTKLPTRHQLLDDRALLSSTTFTDGELSQELEITLVQAAGKRQGKGFVTRKKIANTKRPKRKS